MPQVKDYTELTSPATEDLLYIVDDPSGTPAGRKVTVLNLETLLLGDQMLFVATADATVANSTSELTVVGSGSGSLTLPANFFTVGKTIRVRAWGHVSDTATPNLNMRLKIGGAEIVATGNIATGGALSNDGWKFECEITCRATGASGTVMVQGEFNHAAIRTDMPNTATDTIDTTGTLAVDVTAQWSVASASNTISGTNAIVERLN